MAIPIIQIAGSLSGAGTAGESRFVTANETVTLTDTEPANAGASYQWTILSAPIGAGTTLVGATTASPTFTAPLVTTAGSILIRCVVNGVDEARTIAAVALPQTGARIPAFRERDEWDAAGNAEGWHEAMTVFMRAVDTSIGGPIQLIQTIVPPFTTSTVTFSGLDGDSDGAYQLRMRWRMVAPSNARLAIRPNGVTTDQYASWTSSNSLGTTQSSQASIIGGVCESEDTQYYVFDMYARTGTGPRTATWYGGSVTGTTGPTTHTVQGFSTWDDQGTGISSLTIAVVDAADSPLVNQISTTSRFELYRLPGL